MKKKVVHVLCTGGTFDKVYGAGLGIRDLGFPETSAVTKIATRFGIQDLTVDYDLLRAKDSLDMTDADRDAIADWCNQHDRERCIVVHGTDTMVQTAQFIAKHCPGKVIILTGALQPACMRDTDAEFNLGGAIIAAKLCFPGVYIAMSGNVYSWYNCQKNSDTGHFEAITAN